MKCKLKWLLLALFSIFLQSCAGLVNSSTKPGFQDAPRNSWNVLQTIHNPDADDVHNFGRSIAVNGNNLLVGSQTWSKDNSKQTPGRVYLFDAESGKQLWIFEDPTPPLSRRRRGIYNYGTSTALSGSTVVIGDSNDKTDAIAGGQVYVFDAVTGKLRHTLAKKTPKRGDLFGHSVTANGNMILVGAVGDDAYQGKAYLFDSVAGKLLHIFSNPNPHSSWKFGQSVALNDKYALVGTSHAESELIKDGEAYLFNVSTGALLHTFANPSPSDYDNFAFRVALTDNTVVISAMGDDTDAEDAGRAYLFDAFSGRLLRTLSKPSPAAGDFFGGMVAVSGDKVLIGTPNDNTEIESAGQVYVFNLVSGALIQKLRDEYATERAHFGSRISIDNKIAAASVTSLSVPGRVIVFSSGDE